MASVCKALSTGSQRVRAIVASSTRSCKRNIDFFRCESLILKNHWVLDVMDHCIRRIIGFGVHAGAVDGPSFCRMFNRAIRGADSSRYISSDSDPLFRFHRWKANLRILEVTEVKTVPYMPIAHPFVQRLIGTIRREYLDFVPFWTARDSENKLLSFKEFYNDQRCHFVLNGDTPCARTGKFRPRVADLDSYGWRSYCRSLYHLPIAAWIPIRQRQAKLNSFKDFYNNHRYHHLLNGDPPVVRARNVRPLVVDLRSDRWKSHCRGLYHLPVAASIFIRHRQLDNIFRINKQEGQPAGPNS